MGSKAMSLYLRYFYQVYVCFRLSRVKHLLFQTFMQSDSGKVQGMLRLMDLIIIIVLAFAAVTTTLAALALFRSSKQETSKIIAHNTDRTGSPAG